MSVEFDDAYDEYFDSLTGAQRNRALQPPEPIRPTTPTVQPKVHWFVATVGLGMQVTGVVIEGIGEVLKWIGQGLQTWGRNMRV